LFKNGAVRGFEAVRIHLPIRKKEKKRIYFAVRFFFYYCSVALRCHRRASVASARKIGLRFFWNLFCGSGGFFSV